jgi:hypothetical protein
MTHRRASSLALITKPHLITHSSEMKSRSEPVSGHAMREYPSAVKGMYCLSLPPRLRIGSRCLKDRHSTKRCLFLVYSLISSMNFEPMIRGFGHFFITWKQTISSKPIPGTLTRIRAFPIELANVPVPNRNFSAFVLCLQIEIPCCLAWALDMMFRSEPVSGLAKCSLLSTSILMALGTNCPPKGIFLHCTGDESLTF